MSNPDKSTSNLDSLTISIPISILFLLITVVLFLFKDSIPFFNLILWILFPIVGYIICAGVNILSQYRSCQKIDAGKAFLGGLPSLGTIYLGLAIASISYCRIPVASVIAPLMIGRTVNITNNSSSVNINSLKNSNSKECCSPRLTLETIESRYPLIAGISHGFYVMFSIIFGLTIGNGISAIC